MRRSRASRRSASGSSSRRPVHDVLGAMRDGGFDAVFVAVGAQIGKRAYVPAGEAAHIVDAVTLLRSMEGEERPSLGRRVAVYGGGNTAMDAARTAKRLGAEEAIVVYRRTRDRMPAHDFEVEEAEEEGIRMKWLSTVKHADGGKLVLERMELDETGFPQPTGELEELEADSLVLALGQESDLSLLDGVPGIVVDDGVVQVGPDLMTGHPGIFAGGDIVLGRADGDGRRRPRQEGGPLDRRLAARRSARIRARSPAPPASSTSTRGTTRTRRERCSRCSSWHAAARRSRRWSAGSTSRRRSSRRGAACRAATASTATTASRVCPDNAVLKVDGARAAPTRSTTTTARAVGSAPPSARAARSRWSRRRSEQIRPAPAAKTL